MLIIECFHSRGQHLCKFIGTKEIVCIRKEFNSHRTGLGHQHGRLFFVLGHHMNMAAVTSREVLITYGLCYNAVIRSNPLAMRTNYFFPPPPLALSSFLIQYLTIRTRYRKLRQILADK